MKSQWFVFKLGLRFCSQGMKILVEAVLHILVLLCFLLKGENSQYKVSVVFYIFPSLKSFNSASQVAYDIFIYFCKRAVAIFGNYFVVRVDRYWSCSGLVPGRIN
jgi:hypothetical protein